MSTPIAWSDVVGFASGLSTVSSSAQIDILAYVEIALNACYFGGECSPAYRLARIYLAAHMGAGGGLGGSTGTRGPVTAEAAGGLSRSYGGITTFSSATTLDQALGRTVYGGYLLEMIYSSAARGPFVL